MQTFYGHGKLLLTGEYTVLDGALALAVPTRFGQKLEVTNQEGQSLHWKSLDVDGNTWFEANYHPEKSNKVIVHVGEPAAGQRLAQILTTAVNLRPEASNLLSGKSVTTLLEFDQEWGLGSSSTLLYCLSEWLNVDAYSLLKATFGGSGYDLACAATSTPLIYQLQAGKPVSFPVEWAPPWVDKTYFVYRNQKQNSRAGIKTYRDQKKSSAGVEAISQITATLTKTLLLAEAQLLLQRHEEITSQLVGLPTVKAELFPDFPGIIKSLGAWGGDFCWVLTELNEREVRGYFSAKGFETVLGWEEMVLGETSNP